MTAVATSRVVAEIYRGIDFPSDWISKPETIGVGMTRDVLLSVVVLFDEKLELLAACWRVENGDEKFVRRCVGEAGQKDLLADFDRVLSEESLRVGAPDLFATLVWAPTDLRPDQGKKINKLVVQSGRSASITGWNMAPPLIVANAGNLLLMTRRADNGLDLPVPESAGEMIASLSEEVPQLMIVLPGNYALEPERWSIQKKMAVFFGSLLLLGIALSALALRFE
ncbi:hypothetical protein GCM10007862_28710 [Dyella lipolytica]|uniref:Uncharacterized protein n=1 Tax=Dyella lipolytica TaxID=1867835 RepID=A0ABW8IYI9_9GAMM|nr:hypothetical protein [Dyella lipolytica]GLQ47820.1 hypothetical protein GCM10007862_28710 [Dyella lipolytica]